MWARRIIIAGLGVYDCGPLQLHWPKTEDRGEGTHQTQEIAFLQNGQGIERKGYEAR